MMSYKPFLFLGALIASCAATGEAPEAARDANATTPVLEAVAGSAQDEYLPTQEVGDPAVSTIVEASASRGVQAPVTYAGPSEALSIEAPEEK